MSGTPTGPAIVVLETDAVRLETPVDSASVPNLPPQHPFRLAGVGLTVLLGGLFVLLVVGLIADQFARAPVLGWATLAVTGVGGGIIALAVWRGLASLRQLRRVDRLRAELTNPATTHAAALSWLETIGAGPAVVRSVETAEGADEILRILRGRPSADLDAQVAAVGKRAAWQVAAMTAAMPSPVLDMLIVLWRSWRLVLDVAVLHGLRPSGIGSLVLLRRTLMSAASVGMANVGVTAAVTGVLNDPDLHRLAGGVVNAATLGIVPGELSASLLARATGDAAAAGVAARRMIVLARAAAAACSPIPPSR